MTKLLRSLKRGFTIVEVAVAMTVITIVSISTIKVVQKSRIQAATTSKYALARSIANNALEVFKYADTENEFYVGLLNVTYSVKKNNSTYTFSDNLYTLTIVASFEEETRDSFMVRCVDYENKQLFQFYYTKAE